MSHTTERTTPHERFLIAITSAYDVNDVLDTFSTLAIPLVEASISLESAHAYAAILSGVAQLVELTLEQGGFLSQDFERLAEITAMCDRSRLTDLRNAFRLYLATLHRIAASPPPQCWCESTILALACPSCGRNRRYRLWRVINTSLRSDLTALAASGQLCDGVDCHYCGTWLRSVDFLYCDPMREEFLVFWPFDDEDKRQAAIGRYWSCLNKMPLELRGGKTQTVFVDGMPIALFKEDYVAGLTCVFSKQEFLDVVTDDIYFYGEPMDLSEMDDYFAGRDASMNGDWAAAAASFARSFIMAPMKPSFVRKVAQCFQNMGRVSEAAQLMAWREKLLNHLVEAQVIQRIVRRRGPHGGENTTMYFQILEFGLPLDWNLGELMDAMKRIAEGA